MSDIVPVLRIIEIATGQSLEGGREIRYALNGEEGRVKGRAARQLEEDAIGSMGMLGDLPAILVEYLNLVSTDEQSPVDAAWMSKEERTIYQQNKKAKGFLGQGISIG